LRHLPIPMPGQLASVRMTPESVKMDLYLVSEEDIPHEEELIRSPYSLKPWLHYLEHKTDQPLHEKVFILERACRALPGSYKLWKMYLDIRVQYLEGLNPAKYEEEYDKVNEIFERSLVLLNKVTIFNAWKQNAKN
jgi:pre-mRNA-splicing factor SYF1